MEKVIIQTDSIVLYWQCLTCNFETTTGMSDLTDSGVPECSTCLESKGHGEEMNLVKTATALTNKEVQDGKN